MERVPWAEMGPGPKNHGWVRTGFGYIGPLMRKGPNMKAPTGVPTERLHLWLMLALTFSTGVVDALGYLGLDQVFTGNMTGNVLLLGMAFAGGTDLPMLRPALALGCFMLGAALAGRVLRPGPEGWSPRVSAMFLVVTGWMTLLAVFTSLVDVQADEILGSVTTSSMAAAMGIQAGTARHLRVTDVSTVVVTSTITGLASDSRLAGGTGRFWARRVLAVALILAGALAGAAALSVGLWLGFVLSALISASVFAVGTVRARGSGWS